MDSSRPSQDLLRALTDEHVLRALIRHRRLTRAELAAEIGISKPTAGESVRRLTERRLVADTGERTPGGRGRGRVGSYYALSPTVGVALAVTIAPAGITAERLDVYGDTAGRAFAEIRRPDEVAAALRTAVFAALTTTEQAATPTTLTTAEQAAMLTTLATATTTEQAVTPVRLAVVSAADPVDRTTGRLVQLPDAPFLVGDLDPVAVLAPYVSGPVLVDNDVNWAALAERDSAGADFAYLYLGEGLGCAIVNDGVVRRGKTGLTGEIAHLLTAGPGGRAVRLIELFGELGLRRPGSTAIDVERLLAAGSHDVIAAAVGGVVAAVIALADPEEIVVGGAWGPALIDGIRAAAGRMPRRVPIRAARAAGDPVLGGVRAEALRRLREQVTAAD